MLADEADPFARHRQEPLDDAGWAVFAVGRHGERGIARGNQPEMPRRNLGVGIEHNPISVVEGEDGAIGGNPGEPPAPDDVPIDFEFDLGARERNRKAELRFEGAFGTSGSGNGRRKPVRPSAGDEPPVHLLVFGEQGLRWQGNG